MKKFKIEDKTLVFYKKEGDSKYSFLIENEEQLTESLLSQCKTLRVKEKDIHYAVKGINEKLKTCIVITKTKNVMNPIIELAELCQKKFRSNIETRVIDKVGEDHSPTIFVEIELPNGKIYEASGCNQKDAKQKAALKALLEL